VDQDARRGHDEASIRQVLARFVDAWNRHDAAAFAMVFAEDADFTNVRGMRAHGRAAIEAFHAPLFATRFKDSHQEIDQIEVRFLQPDAAAVDAWWQMTGARTAQGQERSLRKGLLNLVVMREHDRWSIVVMHNTELPSS
jgi:uncharacterized protein (TIGR02246 family)